MRVESAGDLIYFTYFMIKWDEVKQGPSDVRCTNCGGPMNKAEPAVDSKGQKYDCYVCHTDKQVVWVKTS